MGFLGRACCVVVLLVVVLAAPALAGNECESKRVEHTETFLSPGIKMRPGDVTNKYYDVEAPVGHFATVDFNAELVYDNGEPVPLSDVYLHHWVLLELIIPEGDAKLVGKELQETMSRSPAHAYHVKPSNVGWVRRVKEAWAKGGETRHLNSTMPAPYGVVSGGDGLRTQWVLNVHGIDTRGALHRMGCTECRCDLFTGVNRTALPDDDYVGGLYCCLDETRCLLRDDFNGDDETLERIVHLKYTWTYVAFDACIVPLTNWQLDVTSYGDFAGSVEYNVEGHCQAEDFHKPECVDVRETVIEAKCGGDMVYGVAHLHAYSLDSTLLGEDGRVICHSPPIYGHGTAAGDEKGYVVGIRHCNPSFSANGLGKIKKGEKLRLQVKYTKVDGPHTGVMGILFVKIAEEADIAVPGALSGTGNRKILN